MLLENCKKKKKRPFVQDKKNNDFRSFTQQSRLLLSCKCQLKIRQLFKRFFYRIWYWWMYIFLAATNDHSTKLTLKLVSSSWRFHLSNTFIYLLNYFISVFFNCILVFSKCNFHNYDINWTYSNINSQRLFWNGVILSAYTKDGRLTRFHS